MFSAMEPERSRGRFSLGEAAALAGVEEKAARHAVNDVLEKGVGTLGARDVLFFALREATREVCPTVAFQRALYRKLHEANFRVLKSPAVEVEMETSRGGRGMTIRIETAPIAKDILDRIRAFRAGARRVSRNIYVVSGTLVFKGTRIPVEMIGSWLKQGVPPSEIYEDWPYLTNVDLEFARIYVELNPPRGRPRKPLEIRYMSED